MGHHHSHPHEHHDHHHHDHHEHKHHEHKEHKHHGKHHHKQEEQPETQTKSCTHFESVFDLNLIQDPSQPQIFTQCQVDYYTETFSFMALGMLVATFVTSEFGQQLMMDTANYTMDALDQTARADPSSPANYILGATDELADMALSTLDEISQYEINWGFLISIEKAFMQTLASMWRIILNFILNDLFMVMQPI